MNSSDRDLLSRREPLADPSDLDQENDMHVREWLRTFRPWRKAGFERDESEPRVEDLRADFKARYHSFRMLLNANNKSLEIMTEMEEALRGHRPMGMSFVRSRCARVATNVFQMLKSLNELAPNKYEVLYDKFVQIQDKIIPFITSEAPSESGAWVVPLKDLDRAASHQVGYKMASLGELASRLGLVIPNGFVITAQAYRQLMEHRQLTMEIDELIQSAEPQSLDERHRLSEDIQKKIESAPLPEGLAAVISRAYRQLENEERRDVAVAMRSSALGEDAPGTSFAGQYATEFDVRGESILLSYKRVVASKYCARAIMYRLNHGIRDEDIAMCVGCMPIVDAVAGGVAYSRNPLDAEDLSVIIQSVWGLPKLVVEGSSASDLFVVSRDDPPRIVRKEIASKEQAFRYHDGHCQMEPTGDGVDQPSLSDGQVLELARLALQIETHFGAAQDIEWALRQDRAFILLQSRPFHQRIVEKVPEDQAMDTRATILTGGTIASPGIASGPVFVVRKEADLLQFPEGSVLVAAQALPYWATALDRATAVVTEQGSIVGHLASVAREFQVPAILGVEAAMEKLEYGQVVTVDAERGRVLDGHHQGRTAQRRPVASLFTGSPVYQSLRGAAEHVLPLRLLDPDAPGFRPDKCTTFHDITRFCHEKAVQEMFQVGTRRSFPERSARQLHVEVPMQFWVIDLDDGFAADTPMDRFIKLDHIVSIPMLALWRGMTAVPWKGPPPVDTRGFMSVLARSATDPGLDPAISQKYAARNYFMISKNFCSLHSRFGYHFSTVESLVSDRASENYVSFIFKGGAASIERRVRRVRLVAELLEEWGFRTEIHEDSARARIEGYGRDYMESRLEVLGYVSIHTRQLDMVMTNAAATNFQKQRMRNDLEKMLANRIETRH